MSTKPGDGIWRTGGAFGSPIHTLFCARISDKQSHPANGTPTDTAGKPPLWRSRSETDEASWGTAVGPPLYTTHWGLLKQPDNQKLTKEEQSATQKKFHCLLKAPGDTNHYLAAIDQAMEWKLKAGIR